MVGNEINEQLQAGFMGALDESFEFGHPGCRIVCKIRIYVVVVCYCIWRTGLPLHDGGD